MDWGKSLWLATVAIPLAKKLVTSCYMVYRLRQNYIEGSNMLGNGNMVYVSSQAAADNSRASRDWKSRIFWACISLVAGQALTGCALLYRPEDDKLAQSASKSLDEAQLGKALDAEREALGKAQRERHDIVKRSEFARRDAMLALVIGGTKVDTTWVALEEAVGLRMTYLNGGGKVLLPANCNPLLSIARTDYDFSRTRTFLESDNVKLAAQSAGETVPLSCSSLPTKLTPRQAANPLLGPIVKGYDLACTSEKALQACVSAHMAGGELERVYSRIGVADKERETLESDIVKATKVFKDALAVADAAKPAAGAAQNLASFLEQKLDDIEALGTKPGAVNSVTNKLGFSELAILASLEQRKGVVESYITALQGIDPGEKDISQHRTYLVANLVNRVTGKPAPPTAGLVLQAELYRQQIANTQARLRRANESLDTLRSRHASLVVELSELQKAKAYLDASTKGNCRMVSLYESFLAGKGCEIFAGGALFAFNNAWTLGRMPAELADYRWIDVHEQLALDESVGNLTQTQTILRASLDQIVKLNAAGIKPEEIAALWQALGITAIAVRIK